MTGVRMSRAGLACSLQLQQKSDNETAFLQISVRLHATSLQRRAHRAQAQGPAPPPLVLGQQDPASSSSRTCMGFPSPALTGLGLAAPLYVLQPHPTYSLAPPAYPPGPLGRAGSWLLAVGDQGWDEAQPASGLMILTRNVTTGPPQWESWQ